jgi:arsenate reductase-like glutaredoxin family protein
LVGDRQPRFGGPCDSLKGLEKLFTVETGMEVQIFGTRKSVDTRKAMRFFSDRRVKTHFVDLAERAASRGELNRFAQKFGVSALIDRQSRRYLELGLAHARLSDETWLNQLVEEPLLLRVPLTRSANRLTIGLAEEAWREWVQAP